jgi:glycine cleavage system H protein
VNHPAHLKYTKDHEWLKIEEGKSTIGITSHATGQLGDVVFVELPEVGRNFNKGDVFGVVESVKAVVDCYMPVSGEIIEINDNLVSRVEIINADPYETGWMIKIKMNDPSETSDLLDVTAYQTYLSEIGD